MAVDIFTDEFLAAVQSLVERHHTIYPHLPPQGLFFEDLVQQACRVASCGAWEVVPTTPNSPQHDLLVAGVRLSIKSETGKATKRERISITKFCTTETGEWNAAALVQHAISHLNRYDKILMLRAIWGKRVFEYQLLDVPVSLLARMTEAQFAEVGTRKGRRSIAGYVKRGDEQLFRVHFDGADGKCQIHGLMVSLCNVLRTWQQPIA